MGTCTYTLAKPCHADDDFHIMLKGEHRYGNKKVSYAKYILVSLNGDDLEVKLDQNKTVYVGITHFCKMYFAKNCKEYFRFRL